MLQRTSSRRRLAAALVVAAMATLVLLIWLDGNESRQPEVPPATRAPKSKPVAVTPASIRGLPLRGTPLRSSGGLRVLVADAPAPFIFDVDRGTVERITGLPRKRERGVTALPLGNDALVVSTLFCAHCRDSDVFLVRHDGGAATPLGRAWEAIASRDGRGVWMLRRNSNGGCVIGELGLDGKAFRPARAMSCRTGLLEEMPAGLLTTFTGPQGRNAHSSLLRPNGTVIPFPDSYVQPVVGNLVLTGADRDTPLVLHDLVNGTSRRLRWPSRPGYGLGEVTGQAGGTLATVDFTKYSPKDKFDLWVLDTTNGRWQHLPTMPADIVPKTIDVKWTPDGRIVILAPNALGIWRPGDAQIAVRPIPAPKQPGSQFVVW